MIYPIFVMKDLKKGFMSPTVDLNEASALRQFHMAMVDDHSVIRVHHEDFSLYKIGEFDNESGIINAFYSPEFIADATSLVEV